MRVLRWGLLTVLALLACKPKPAETLANEDRIPEVATVPRPWLIAAARPELDLSSVLPDPTEQARWPLSAAAHPALEPRFAIASALAEPGVDWIELCRMGAQHRHLSGDRDLQTYLQAWCHAASGEPAEAFVQLAVMANPIVAGLAPAIRDDLANLLVQNGDADHAEHLLAKAKVEDIAIFDLLAASYFEVGKNADAAEINERAIDRQQKTSDAAKCHRYAKRIILEPPGARALYLMELDALGDEPARSRKKLSTDPECRQLDAELACWTSPARSCERYLFAQGADATRYGELLDAYFTWPLGEATSNEWAAKAIHAENAQPLPGADALEIAALLAGFRVVQCDDLRELMLIHGLASSLQHRLAHTPAVERQLEALAAQTGAMAASVETCRANRWAIQ